MAFSLFSIFDPCGLNGMSVNWLCLLGAVLGFPSFYWVSSSRVSKLCSVMVMSMLSELSPLSKNIKFILLTPISLFIFIVLTNILGMLPFFFTSSSHLVYTTALALSFWLSLILYSLTNNSGSLLAHLVPSGAPTLLIPFMVVIEIISAFIRPLTLAVRLCANMIAGHLIMTLFSTAISNISMGFIFFMVIPQLALITLELAVAFIQAYVFSVLSTLYLSEAL